MTREQQAEILTKMAQRFRQPSEMLSMQDWRELCVNADALDAVAAALRREQEQPPIHILDELHLRLGNHGIASRAFEYEKLVTELISWAAQACRQSHPTANEWREKWLNDKGIRDQRIAELEAELAALRDRHEVLQVAYSLAKASTRAVALREQEEIERLKAELADAEQQLTVLRPGGTYAWKTRAEKAEAELAAARGLVTRWRTNAAMLAEGSKGEGVDPSAGMQRACANMLEAALRTQPLTHEQEFQDSGAGLIGQPIPDMAGTEPRPNCTNRTCNEPCEDVDGVSYCIRCGMWEGNRR